MKKYLLKWFGIVLVCGCVIGIILAFRFLTLDEGKQTEYSGEVSAQTASLTPYFQVIFPEKYDGEIRIEENLMEKAVQIEFTGISEFLFSAIRIEENDSRVIGTEQNYEGNCGTLTLQMNDMYACEGSQEDSVLSLEFELVRDKYDSIVVIDPGHGGETDTGTIAYGYQEKDLTLALAKAVKEQIEAQLPDSCVCLTRIDDTPLSEQEREQFANQLEADLYLSIHMNADSSTHATEGVSTYYNKQAPKGKQFAEILQKNMEKSTESTLQFDVQADTEIFTKEFALPSLVIEAGYLTNKQEAMKIGTAEYRKLLADGVTAGIREIWNE